MVEEGTLSEVLSEFARTLITDFSIQGILDHLVGRIVEILPITGAGVTLIGEGRSPRYVAASDHDALVFERLQSELNEGPCLNAYSSGEAVAVADLRADARFIRFGPAAVAAGLAAVFTFPLRHGDGQLGALDLYRNKPGSLPAQDMSAAQTLADVAAAYLLNSQAREDARVAAENFHHIALHDPLTGLSNRLMLQQRLEHAAARAHRLHTRCAILFADLERFKQINDTYGHRVGDDLLLAVSKRLSLLVREGDTLARVSGDEFVFLCEDLDSPTDIELLAKRIEESFVEPFVVSQMMINLTASVGVAFAGPGQELTGQPMANADAAANQIKTKGSDSRHIFDIREALEANERNSMEGELRAALAGDELDIAYQPVVRATDRAIVGVEALLRWVRPNRRAVPSLTMIRIAEQSSLINDMGEWVLERSCLQRRAWLTQHPHTPLDLSVNVSALQLMRAGFAQTVRRILAKTHMDPTALILEVTEDIMIEDNDRVFKVLTELRSVGIRLALDDFGTGYSSLSYLRRLPVSIIKIDRAFIADMSRPPGIAIVSAIAQLADSLGLTVIAEGIETQSQHDDIVKIGCEYAQGFFYARPMSASSLSTRIASMDIAQVV